MDEDEIMLSRPCAPGKFSIATWGPNAWSHLHTLAFLYPSSPTPKDKSNMYSFVVAFANTIPCDKCRQHFLAMIQSDIDRGEESRIFVSQDIFARATVRWHNTVNERLGKPIITYDNVYKMYHAKYGSCDFSQYVYIIVIIMLIVYIYIRPSKSRL